MLTTLKHQSSCKMILEFQVWSTFLAFTKYCKLTHFLRKKCVSKVVLQEHFWLFATLSTPLPHSPSLYPPSPFITQNQTHLKIPTFNFNFILRFIHICDSSKFWINILTLSHQLIVMVNINAYSSEIYKPTIVFLLLTLSMYLFIPPNPPLCGQF